MEIESKKSIESAQACSSEKPKKVFDLEQKTSSYSSENIRSSETNKNENKEKINYENNNSQISRKHEENSLAPSNIMIPNLKEFIGNQSQGKSIHSKFIFLKQQLNLSHFMRKTQIDSLLKKCKSKVFKIIHEALQKCLNIKPGRLPQLFITNIKIEYNKNYLAKTILEIYQEFNVFGSLEDLISRGFVITTRKRILEDFLNMTFKQAYENYINSHQFKKDYEHICEKEGQQFAILFSFIAHIFIQYYQKSRGNKRKARLNDSENQDSLDSEDSDLNEEGFDTEDKKVKIVDEVENAKSSG